MSTHQPSRRSVVAAAWGVPAVVAATAAPAFAGSSTPAPTPKWSYRLTSAGLDVGGQFGEGSVTIELFLADATHTGTVTIHGVGVLPAQGKFESGHRSETFDGPFVPGPRPVLTWILDMKAGYTLPPRNLDVVVSPAGQPSFTVPVPVLIADLGVSVPEEQVYRWNEVIEFPIFVHNSGTRVTSGGMSLAVTVHSTSVQSIDLVDGSRNWDLSYASGPGRAAVHAITSTKLAAGETVTLKARLRPGPNTTSGFSAEIQVDLGEGLDLNPANDTARSTVTVFPTI